MAALAVPPPRRAVVTTTSTTSTSTSSTTSSTSTTTTTVYVSPTIPDSVLREFLSTTTTTHVHPVPAPSPPSADPQDPPPTVGTAGVEQWRELVATYFRAEDVERALRIMQCESLGLASATNDGPSRAAGLFQHLPKYWSSRSAAAGVPGADIYDPTANVIVAAWLRDQRGGWSHWTCR